MMKRFSRSTALAVLSVVLSGFVAESASAQTTLIDTATNATNFAIASTPHTYVGDAFTNNALPANTTQFQVTGGSVYLASTTAATYTDIQARIQLWNTVTPTSTTAVFSNPLGLITVDFGGGTLAASSVYTLPFTLGSALTLQGGNGTNWGITVNFQVSTTAGTAVADNTATSPALAYNTGTSGYAAGTVTTGTSPVFGYYRNVESQTNFNFVTGDQRSLSTAGANYQGLAFSLAGNPVVSAGPTAPEPSTVACLGTFLLVAGGIYLRRRQTVASV